MQKLIDGKLSQKPIESTSEDYNHVTKFVLKILLDNSGKKNIFVSLEISLHNPNYELPDRFSYIHIEGEKYGQQFIIINRTRVIHKRFFYCPFSIAQWRKIMEERSNFRPLIFIIIIIIS